MNFNRVILLDFKKAIVSKRFILALAGAILINFLNLIEYIEIDPGVTVTYLLNIQDSTGGCLMCMLFLVSVPYASSFHTDYISNQYKFEIIRCGIRSYCISKAITTVIMAVMTLLLSNIILVCFLGMFIPIFPTNELALRVARGTQNALFTNLLSTDFKWLYILCIMLAEGLRCGFLAGVALYASTISRNPFVIFSTPIIVFYAWISLFNTGKLPDILRWHIFNGIFVEDMALWVNMGLTVLYYSILIVFITIAFVKGARRRIANG